MPVFNKHWAMLITCSRFIGTEPPSCVTSIHDSMPTEERRDWYFEKLTNLRDAYKLNPRWGREMEKDCSPTRVPSYANSGVVSILCLKTFLNDAPHGDFCQDLLFERMILLGMLANLTDQQKSRMNTDPRLLLDIEKYHETTITNLRPIVPNCANAPQSGEELNSLLLDKGSSISLLDMAGSRRRAQQLATDYERQEQHARTMKEAAQREHVAIDQIGTVISSIQTSQLHQQQAAILDHRIRTTWDRMERLEEQQERSRKLMVIRHQKILQLGRDRDGDKRGLECLQKEQESDGEWRMEICVDVMRDGPDAIPWGYVGVKSSSAGVDEDLR